jgi:hypothetical protein
MFLMSERAGLISLAAAPIASGIEAFFALGLFFVPGRPHLVDDSGPLSGQVLSAKPDFLT